MSRDLWDGEAMTELKKYIEIENSKVVILQKKTVRCGRIID